jgi:hypothetical protein
METIKLPEFISTFVAGRQLLIRTTNPHLIGEVVQYQSTDQMLQAVGLLNVDHVPYFINTKRNVAIIFVGAMGKVQITPGFQQQIREVIFTMADYYLKNF